MEKIMEISIKNGINNEKFISVRDNDAAISAIWTIDGVFVKNNGIIYDYEIWCHEFYEIFGMSFEEALNKMVE